MKKRALHILFTTVIVIIGLPLLLGIVGGEDVVKPLKGVTIAQSIHPFNIHNWRSMDFQLGVSKYLNQNFCFRPSLIRFYNQLEYSVFNQVTNRNIVKGKDSHLFERWFINSYFGTDFLGTEKIDRNVQKLIVIDSVLKSKGVHFIVAMAPGKASVYPEKIPDYLLKDSSRNTNYKTYRTKLNKSGISIFDINGWFIKMKPDFERNLFTKGGTHWSRDGAMLVLDSLLRRIEHETGEEYNKIIFEGITKTQTPKDPDIDILKISNLLSENIDEDYYYPDFHYEKAHPKNGKLIVISDSFFWILFDAGLDNSFQSVDYWYYFNKVFSNRFEHAKKIEDINISKELQEAEVVLLMASPSPLNKLGWGFINEAYDLLLKGIDKEAAIRRVMQVIESDPDWFASVKTKAVDRNITIDSMLRLDAEYIYNRK